MNLLFVTLCDIGSMYDSNIYTDLLREFVKKGHKIFIVSPTEKRHGKETKTFSEDNCILLKVKIGNLQKTNIIEKGISTILLEHAYKNAIKKYFSNVKFDLILYSTPPITLESVVSFIKERDGAKSYLLLKDIFPQNALDLEMLSESNLIYKYFRKKGKKLYSISDFIGCMSQANVEYILKNNSEINPGIVEICPNSIEPKTIVKDIKKIKEIRAKYNIPFDKTIFLYGGNLGKPQGIDFLVDCLKSNKTNKNVFFVVVGSGTEFNKLNNYIALEKPENTKLFTHLPKHDYELLANSCDVGLLFLDKRFTIPNFPSRMLSYMQASIPILAATDSNSDVGSVIESGKFGLWCKSDNVQEFNKKLDELFDADLRAQLGKNARKYLEDNYTVKHSFDIIMKHFEREEV